LTYSQGFTPHPKIAFASPLPLGFTGEAEIMDVTLDERVEPADFERRLAAETTEDLALLSVTEIPAGAPQPQAALLWADYRVEIEGLPIEEVRSRIDAFLASDEFPWTEQRNDKTRTYDLRQGVGQLTAEASEGGVLLSMRLRADQQMTARPEQVVAALFEGGVPGVYRRMDLILDDSSPAREAWRRVGQFQ
jgi:radical SAM-linked protein